MSFNRRLPNPNVTVFWKDGIAYCILCFCLLEEDYIHVHHFIPVSYGGCTLRWNCLLICSRCHRLLHEGLREEIIRLNNIADCVLHVRYGLLPAIHYTNDGSRYSRKRDQNLVNKIKPFLENRQESSILMRHIYFVKLERLIGDNNIFMLEWLRPSVYGSLLYETKNVIIYRLRNAQGNQMAETFLYRHIFPSYKMVYKEAVSDLKRNKRISIYKKSNRNATRYIKLLPIQLTLF